MEQLLKIILDYVSQVEVVSAIVLGGTALTALYLLVTVALVTLGVWS